jgi:hypothetical protein
MKRRDETMLLPAPAWSDPRVHLLDDIWLLAIFAILLAVGLPFLFGSFEIDVVRAAAGLLALGAVHVAFTLVATPSRVRSVWRTRASSALNALGVVIIGYVWQHAGGLQNPMFLAVFALPVIGSAFISRWQPHLVSLLAVAVVCVVALAQVPELRWYLSGFRGLGNWLAQLFGGNTGTQESTPFPGFYAPSGYFLVLLEVFAILIVAAAVAAEHLGTVFERIHAQLANARIEAQRGQELWTTLIEHLPAPALLVDVDSSQVICASEQVAAGFCALDTEVAGSNLFEVIRFSYPEAVQELIAGFGGVAPLTMIRVGAELRVTDVRVRHVARRGRRFALVLITDTTDEFIRRVALDVADHAALMVDASGRVLGFNRQATALFPAARTGAAIAGVLSSAGLAPEWWQPQLTGKRRMLVQIPPRIFQATLSAVTLPGEDESLYVIAFLPVGRIGDADTAATGSMSIRELVQP